MAVLQFQTTLTVSTDTKGLFDITRQVDGFVCQTGVTTGLCVVFVQHTSASLIIQENADPSVLTDLQQWMSELVPESRGWKHADEGPDDMPAHVRSAITNTSETIPIMEGKLALGVWQGLYLWEHRSQPHRRKVVVHVMGL